MAGGDDAVNAIAKVRPTLFIACGGTGGEILLRLRRKILEADWNGKRISSLSGFPVAGFLHVDTDSAEFRHRADGNDPLAGKIMFDPEEEVKQILDVRKYTRNIDRYPLVKEWFPQAAFDAIHDFGGGSPGHIRFFSRLFFFDRVQEIKNQIIVKCRNLQANLSNKAELDALGLEFQRDLRIVIVGSMAGGTGSGIFLDMGYLARTIQPEAHVELVFLLAGGFEKYDRRSAYTNTYAALMELEYCMRGNQYVKRWTYHQEEVPSDIKPFNEVYLLDTTNLARKFTNDVKDIYDMVADVFFEDFRNSEFPSRKRAVVVCKTHFKIFPYIPPLEEEGGCSSFTYSRAYSSFGQASLETKTRAIPELRTVETSMEMIRAFFQIKSDVKRDAVQPEIFRMLEELESELKDRRAAQDQGNPMRKVIEEESPPDHNVVFAKAGEWAKEALEGFGDPQAVSQMLVSEDGRARVVNCIRQHAKQKLRDEDKTRDSMFQILSKLPESRRKEIFEGLLAQAMPWLDASLTKSFSSVHSMNQWAAFFAVKGAEQYAHAFRSTLDDSAPSGCGINARCVIFVESGEDEDDRVICYVEISGIPLDVIEPLKTTWRHDYYDEITRHDAVVLHNHKDISRFPHPVVPDPKDLRRMKRDLRLFLEAVALGILRRRDDGSKIYEMEVEPGEWLGVGTEGMIRLVGFAAVHSILIVDEIRGKVDVFDGSQHLALAVLFSYLAEKSFRPRIVRDEMAREKLIPGMGYIQAKSLGERYMLRALRVLPEEALIKGSHALKRDMDAWTVEIPGSRDDVDPTEVDPKRSEPKRKLREEFFIHGRVQKVTAGKFCAGCGAEIPMNAKFCHHCGNKVAE